MLPTPEELPHRVEEEIRLAFGRHHVLRLDADCLQPHSSPARAVMQFAHWLNTVRQGLMGYVCARLYPNALWTVDHLDDYDRPSMAPIPTRAVFETMSAVYRPPEITPEAYLRHLVISTSETTFDHEARTVAALYFSKLGVPTAPTEIQVFADRIHGLLLDFLAAVRSQRKTHTADEIVLAPVGLDATWRRAAGDRGISIRVVNEVTVTALTDWLHNANGPVAVYIPLVNPLTGHVLTRRQAHALAQVVLRHNQDHPQTPAFVFADDSLAESYHSPEIAAEAQPIGAVTGADLGQPELGQMSDWTLTIASVDKMYALPSSPIVFATSTNQWLRTILRDKANTLPSSSDALLAAGALCLTAPRRLHYINEHAAENLRTLRTRLPDLNEHLGFEAFTVNENTRGGWHTALMLHPRLFPSPLDNSFDAFTALLQNYSADGGSTAIALAPAELSCWSYNPRHRDPRLALRINLSARKDDIAEFIVRLDAIFCASRKTAGRSHLRKTG